MNIAIKECIIEERPLTFLNTLDAAGSKFSYKYREFLKTIKKEVKVLCNIKY